MEKIANVNCEDSDRPVKIARKLNTLSVCIPTSYSGRGWSGGAMGLGKLPVPGRPTIWIKVGQGPTALTVGAGGGFYSHLSFLSSFSLSLGDGPI